jgi:DUF2993 family protein
MRKFLIALAVLAVVFVATDRVAVAVAENRISDRAAVAYGLPVKPQVDIAGFPFLTQVLAGDYREIDLRARGIQFGGATLTQLRARLTGVHASLGQVLGHGAATVTARDAVGSAIIGFAELDQRLPHGVRLSPDGNHLRVSGRLTYRGVRMRLSAPVSLRITATGIRVTPVAVTTAGGSGGQAPAAVSRLGRHVPRLSIDITLRTLPLHLRVRSVSVTRSGLRIGAYARNVQFARG